MTLADRIRGYVNQAVIEPARRAGRTEVVLVAGDVHKDMGLRDRMPAICGALDARRFQDEFRVVLARRSGPKYSSTATWYFSLVR